MPTLYVIVVGVLFIGVAYLGKTLEYQVSGSPRVINTVVEEDILPVIKEEDINIDDFKPVKPFLSNKVVVSKSYYKQDDDIQKQENSLIYYEKTYLQNII